MGKTWLRQRSGNFPRKHPHMRGEDEALPFSVAAFIETPPHAWGRPPKMAKPREYGRNTPTCVGKTLIGDDIWDDKQKHPHMRGEDFSGGLQWRRAAETPPHAWGRRTRRLTDPGAMKKHPHMRGEDRGFPRGRAVVLETPPHAWGRRTVPNITVLKHGNTPTCVGKTRTKRRWGNGF